MAETNATPENNEVPQDPTPQFVNPGPSLRKSDPVTDPGHLPEEPPTATSVPPAQPAYMPPPPPYGYQQPQQPYYPYPPQTPTEGLAVASFVLSLIPFFFTYGIPNIVGIILGHVALHNLKTNGKRGHGLALAGVIIGYVQVLFAILLVALFVVLAVTGIANSQKYERAVQSDVRAEVGNINLLITNNQLDELNINQDGELTYRDQNVVIDVAFNDEFSAYTVTGTDPTDLDDYMYSYDSTTDKYTSNDDSGNPFTYNNDNSGNSDGSTSTTVDGNALNTVWVNG